MSRRKSQPLDGYKPKDNEPRFVVTRTMWREVVSCEPLPASIDLRAALNSMRERWAVDGWSVEPPGKYHPYFYASKDGNRLCCAIERKPEHSSG